VDEKGREGGREGGRGRLHGWAFVELGKEFKGRMDEASRAGEKEGEKVGGGGREGGREGRGFQ